MIILCSFQYFYALYGHRYFYVALFYCTVSGIDIYLECKENKNGKLSINLLVVSSAGVLSRVSGVNRCYVQHDVAKVTNCLGPGVNVIKLFFFVTDAPVFKVLPLG